MTQSTPRSNLVRLPRVALLSLLGRVGGGGSASGAADSLREAGVEAAGPVQAMLLGRGSQGNDEAAASADEFWTTLNAVSQELGWGTLHAERVHPGVIALSSPDWFEADGSPADHPNCHFSTGLFAELFHRIAEAEFAAMEIECRSKGDLECSFLIGSPEALEGIYAEMARGDSFERAIATLA